MIITIDGPAASGKSTVAQLLAQQLDFYYINSGLLFRAIAYLAVQDSRDVDNLLERCAGIDVTSRIDMHRLHYRYDKQHGAGVYYDDDNITMHLKNQTIDYVASCLSQLPKVRTWVTAMQRTIASAHSSVIDGRDCGTVVFPNADVKFFLTASVQVRAQRWHHDQVEKKGATILLHDALQAISQRDERDINRSVAPLRIPEDAYYIDNSMLTIAQTVETMYQYIRVKNKEK